MRPLPLTGVTGLMALAVPNVAEAAPRAEAAAIPFLQVVPEAGALAVAPGTIGLAAPTPPSPEREKLPRPAVAIGPIRGERGLVLRQLAAAICSVYRCVSWYRVIVEGEADLDKMDEWGVDGVLCGAVTRRGGESSLRLDLVATSPRPSRTWLLPLTGAGRLAPGLVQQLVRDLQGELGGPATAGAPEAVSTLPPQAAPGSAERLMRDLDVELDSAEHLMRDLEVEVDSAELLARDLDTGLAAPAPAVPPPVAATPPRAAWRSHSGERRPAPWLVAAEVGTFFSSRTLAYVGSSPGPTPLLRGYQGPFAGPFLFVEVFPISRAGDGTPWSGIGLFAKYAFSLGLKTAAGSQEYPSTFSALDAGLEWRLRPFAKSGLALIPALSYQSQEFAVTPPFPGLPDSNLSGVAGSLRSEVPLGGAVTLLLGARYTQWLRARNLIGDGFFPAGSAFAVGAEAGLEVEMGTLSLRALGLYDMTRYSLQAGSRPRFRATDASDTQVAGRAALRARF